MSGRSPSTISHAAQAGVEASGNGVLWEAQWRYESTHFGQWLVDCGVLVEADGTHLHAQSSEAWSGFRARTTSTPGRSTPKPDRTIAHSAGFEHVGGIQQTERLGHVVHGPGRFAGLDGRGGHHDHLLLGQLFDLDVFRYLIDVQPQASFPFAELIDLTERRVRACLEAPVDAPSSADAEPNIDTHQPIR